MVVFCEEPSIRSMRFLDVNGEKISNVGEFFGYFAEMVKLDDKRGSGAAAEVKHQRSAFSLKVQYFTQLTIQCGNRSVISPTSK